VITIALLRILGFIATTLPEAVLRWLCNRVGDLFATLPNARRTVVYANLHHAFPEKPPPWHRMMARESFRRLIEMSVFVVASPWFSRERFQRIISIPQETRDCIESMREGNRGGVALMPHFTLSETLIAFPALYPDLPPFGAIFRPLTNRSLNRWLLATRERFGAILFSRKAGFRDALELIRQGGWVVVLFDQNAGKRGALIPFMGRAASATDLPGIMAQKFSTPAVMAYARRTGFWRAELHLAPLPCLPEKGAVTIASNAWLEDLLRSSEDACADWLWAHRRWKNQVVHFKRLRLEQKTNLIAESLAYRQAKTLPRATRFWVRMPNWLGDAVMAIPLVGAIRRGRPDAEITLITNAALAPLFERLKLADRMIILPERGRCSYYPFFYKLRDRYPDTTILFTNSLRGDLEARLTGSPQRFGMLRPGRRRPLLTNFWRVPADLDEEEVHQVRVWERFLQAFGLEEPLDLTPPPGLSAHPSSSDATPEEPTARRISGTNGHKRFGLICGAENFPAKRWPAEHWRTLCNAIFDQIPGSEITLFGTAADQEIAASITDCLDTGVVRNLMGRTNLPEFIDALGECDVVIANDTGGMHLANACGVPLIAIFGPTNPLRTGPVFTSSVTILQPPGAPPRGGRPISEIQPHSVLEAIEGLTN